MTGDAHRPKAERVTGSIHARPGGGALTRAAAAAVAPAAPATIAVTARPLLLRWAWRCVLGPLDQLFRLYERPVLVLGDELEPDPAALLVDLLHDHVEHVAAADHILDMTDPAGADVRDVQEAVGALLELDERAELGRLHDLARVRVTDLGLLRQRLIAATAASAFVPSVA